MESHNIALYSHVLVRHSCCGPRLALIRPFVCTKTSKVRPKLSFEGTTSLFPPLFAVTTLNQAKNWKHYFHTTNGYINGFGEKQTLVLTPCPVLELTACLCISCWRLLGSRTRWWITIFLRITAYLGQSGG